MTAPTLDRPERAGVCACGCGGATAIAAKTDRRFGAVRGHPALYVHGHNARSRKTPARKRPARATMPATSSTWPRCLGACGFPLVPQKRRRVPHGHRNHLARGLCGSCWGDAARAGRLADYPRATRGRDELLDEWNELRAIGCTRTAAAARLGMRRESFERALYRAAAAGDPRAVLGTP